MEAATSLPFGPLDRRTAHLCIDMQKLFGEATPWHTRWLNRVLPVVVRIAEEHPAQTIFTRFIPAYDPDELPGSWRRYYRRWDEMTLSRLDPRLIELVPPLARLAPPAAIVDKRVYSPFSERRLPRLLRARGIATLVITGAETDMCVLATVLGAVDHGYRVVLAADGLCSLLGRNPRRADDALPPPLRRADRDRRQRHDSRQLAPAVSGAARKKRRQGGALPASSCPYF